MPYYFSISVTLKLQTQTRIRDFPLPINYKPLVTHQTQTSSCIFCRFASSNVFILNIIK